MKHLLQPLRWALPTLLLAGFGANGQALNYQVAGATNVAGTYTDLAATGTAIATANTDDANSAATPIGFSFSYNGAAFTQFVLNTNGYLKLGTVAPAAPYFGAGPQDVTGGPLNSAENNLILPFNFDLEAGNGTGGAEYRVTTTGTAPTRVTTVQWKNVSPKSLLLAAGSTVTIDKQYLNMNFQVKLYEGTNAVEFVYGPAVASTNVSNAEWAVAGIKGSGSATGQNVLAEKLSSVAYSAATFITGAYAAGNAFNVRQTALPDAGRTFRFTTGTVAPPVVPTYATLPVNASFENAWVNGTSTRDLPTASWLNTPATGNPSWRRNDDGASAAWGGLASGGYTPASSQGTFSARFHSYFAATNATGSLDLYANLSGGTGARTLTFDYVNVDGTDKLDVLVSTDGGVTFGATPLLTANTSATFTARTVVIPSSSATAVIRFRATSDFGDTDIGLDNVQVRIVTATRNEALAATVGLYPNPAHRAFTLDVPAGPLRTAAATLHNALGQVVLARALSATGSTAFDVSGLAAGVYSLELKTGDALVVKRVVVE